MKRPMLRRSLPWLVLLAGVPTAAIAAVTPCEADDLDAVPVHYNVDFETEIQPIFSVVCQACHIAGTSGGLSLAEGAAYGNLVGVPANNPNAGMSRVTPGDPEASFMFKKINCTNLNSIPDTPYGRRMPRSGPPYLSAEDQARILDWIQQGAPPASDPDKVFGGGFDNH